jgi:hypothetical protein
MHQFCVQAFDNELRFAISTWLSLSLWTKRFARTNSSSTEMPQNHCRFTFWGPNT